MRPLNDLPALNAMLNSACTILLATGWMLILKKKIRPHAFCMIAALICSAVFLASYLYYHFVIHGRTIFTGPQLVRYVYLAILLSHTILAVVIVPLIVKTVYHAARREWDRHRRIARWAMPLWLYVSFTGVVVYLMLYQLYPAAK